MRRVYLRFGYAAACRFCFGCLSEGLVGRLTIECLSIAENLLNIDLMLLSEMPCTRRSDFPCAAVL